MSLHDTHFSFGKMVLYSLGAGVLVLLVSIPIILLIAQWSPVAGLVVALIAVVATAVLVEDAEIAPDVHWDILGTRLKTVFSNNIRNNFGFLNRADPSGVGKAATAAFVASFLVIIAINFVLADFLNGLPSAKSLHGCR